MPPATASSRIRAFVQWRDPSVYAGEEIDCIITFKNIATPVEPAEHPRDPGKNQINSAQPERSGSCPPSPGHSRKSSFAHRPLPPSRTASVSAAWPRSNLSARGHRPALSLNVVGAPSRGGLQSAPVTSKPLHSATKSHGRSLSIISLGSEGVNDGGRTLFVGGNAKRPVNQHTRRASLQVLPTLSSHSGYGVGNVPYRRSSPLHESRTPPGLGEETLPIRPARRRPGTQSADTTPNIGAMDSFRKGSPATSPEASFQFPNTPKSSKPAQRPRLPKTPGSMHSAQQRPVSPRPYDGWQGIVSTADPLTRIMSEASTTGTPRSSSEFYSMSNHSDETLTSEAPPRFHQNGRLDKPSAQQHLFDQTPTAPRVLAEPEYLMMGFVQTTGHFVVDGGLINGAPFEEVKRKGVQSGGGVVGLERSKRSSGMFGALSWGNIGESLGGLLGGNDASSMAQMKALAGSKNIPLLSTPQNLLFVNLRLAPGESRSYRYRFVLPRGLPPSHKGKAIKVSYSLVLGVQRPEGQTVRLVDLPFRILGSYTSRGETLGHDLMSPYILLQDSARSQQIETVTKNGNAFAKLSQTDTSKYAGGAKKGFEDFLRYTERLVEQCDDTGNALLSPTAMTSRKGSFLDMPPSTMKEVIDLAIMRANFAPRDQGKPDTHSSNRFNIARAGRPVAVITLLRSAYRLGESVIGCIDFTATEAASHINTHSVVIELESAERVDGALALRSSNSINRATRRVHATSRENTLFARQMAFNLAIPYNATPTFETTGVSLFWTLRIEFTTERGRGGGPGDDQPDDSELLEEVSRDDRGTVLIAKERLLADIFDVAIPLKVYGSPGLDEISVASEAIEV